MKRVLKHLIIGLVLSTILFIAFFVLLRSSEMTITEKLVIVFFGIVFGTVGYTLVKLWHDWFYSHFVVFTKNPLQMFIVTYIVDPIVGIVGFNVLGYYLMSKSEWLSNIFEKILQK